MLERINLILKSRNLNAAQFADEIGVQRSSISHILTGRNNASLDFLLKVLKRYPEIDTDWLLTGKGVMIRSTSVISGKPDETNENVSDNSTIFPLNPEIQKGFNRQTNITEERNREIGIMREEKHSESENQSFTDMEKQNKKPDERVNDTGSARQIEKIVIFYSDKTFTEYKPEN